MNSGNIVYVSLEELSNSDYKIVSGEKDITGWPVVGEDGTSVGRVRDLLFDPEQNAIRYIIVDLEPTLLGGEEKVVLFPMGFINLGEDKREVVLPVMHDEQYRAMPMYIIGEVTRETEMEIRSAIGSPAALRIEEEIEELDEDKFYAHHHFDRGNQSYTERKTQMIENPSGEPMEETGNIHKLFLQADHNLHDSGHTAQTNLAPFEVTTEDGRFTIVPQENGIYRIIDNETEIGVIYSEPVDGGVQWRTTEQMGNRFVMMIGAAISAHHRSGPEINRN